MNASLSNVGHGHVTPRADGYKARCGGPGLCVTCNIEQALLHAPEDQTEAARKFLVAWSRLHFGNNHYVDYIKHDLAGDFACELVKVLRAQMKPEEPVEKEALNSYERRKAIQEGHQNAKSDAYFAARHHMLDSAVNRNIFRAGFDRGWDAALEEKGGAA